MSYFFLNTSALVKMKFWIDNALSPHPLKEVLYDWIRHSTIGAVC